MKIRKYNCMKMKVIHIKNGGIHLLQNLGVKGSLKMYILVKKKS